MADQSTADALLAHADEASRWLVDVAHDIDTHRSVPPELAQRLADVGLHRLLTPRAYGGHEVDVATFVRVTESLALGSASAAWCTFISCTSALVAAYLPPEEARRLFERSDLRGAGVFAPRGTARHELRDGVSGYRVNGRWPWGSGCLNAHYISGGCLVMGSDAKPQALADGTPIVYSMVFDRADVQIHDTWHVMGLRGTGSNDFEVQDLFVPATRAVSLMTGQALDRPLYKFPAFGLLALGIAAVALGVGRLAINSLVTLASGKTPQGSSKPLALRPATQEQVARAQARLQAARSYLFQVIAHAWEAATTDGAISIEHRRDLRLAATHAVQEVADIVTAMHRLAGGSSVYEHSALERCVRDANVITQHMMVSDSTFELAGRLLLGLPTGTATL